MRTQDIVGQWESDCVIDPTDLFGAALTTPRLHSKYFKIYLEEKRLLVQLAGAMKLLRLEKYEMYTIGPDSDIAKDWQQKELPDQGKILKAEVQKYIDADLDVLNLEQKYNTQLEKVKFVESIITSLKERGFAIKNAIDMRKFESGA